MKDCHNRSIDYLRLSIIDQCNLRCTYCLPEQGAQWLAPENRLTDDQLLQIVSAFASLGVTKVKLTGGEPLLHPSLCSLVRQIKAIPTIQMVTLTTNGVLLKQQAKQLKEAGIDSINISLDVLNRNRFKQLTRRDVYQDVLDGVHQCLQENISIKLNVVLARELNQTDTLALAELAHHHEIPVRFIELLPIGCAKHLTPLPPDELLSQLKQQYPQMKQSLKTYGNGPAVYYEIPTFKAPIGFISAMSHSFCEQCNRIRVSANGELKTCLHYAPTLNLTPYLNDDTLVPIIEAACFNKPKQHDFKTQSKNERFEQRNMAQLGG